MRNIPPEVLKKMQEEMCRPEGTVEFDYVSETLFDTALPQEVILELAAGAHVFQLVRNERLELLFYHSAPGTGTRVATVDLTSVTPCFRVYIALVWSPSETRLHVGPRVPGGKLVRAEGRPSPVLITAFYSQRERAHFTADDLKEEAVARNRTVLQKIVGDQRINFQDYKEAKKAYRKAYGIKFGEIGVSSNDLALLQQLIHHRHRVVHFSPWESYLPVASGEPEFSDQKLVEKAVDCFNRFVNRLHEATLRLR